MKNLITFLLILISGIIFASLFGILHDQITYSLSPEYYTKFKFEQFGLDYFYSNPRFGAVFVGILATWWVGIPFGLIFGVIILCCNRITNISKTLARLYTKLSFLTIAIGFLGFLYCILLIGDHDLWHYRTPDTVLNKRMFIAVGMMHNFSYVGGLVSLVYGIVQLIRIKRSIKTVNEQV